MELCSRHKLSQPCLKKETEVLIVMEDSCILQLYHERWVHQDKQHIKGILQKELGISVYPDKKPCESCTCGKTRRLPFETRKKASCPGELVSADVCGPFEYSFHKKRFLVVFKDS
ncbi:hypothetical protein AVEN_116174-1 [Araneus ventricosus]|uniref:GAG-pre-integrase domain-containing protein n=1 Tax=Araneus ventricosus TaxID=182803 RepID=A0A4Y2LF81_ARAVE|nr:hypothetical protein AVEN_116174-1 [Araneus ventricosus]